MPQDVTVRAPTREDFDAWSHLWAGSPRVYWQTHETNTTAMTLYDKVAAKSGFVVYRHDL